VSSLRLTLSSQLDEPELVDPDDTLAERMKSRGNNVSTLATRLSSGNKLSTLFPQPPREDHLYILVQRSSTSGKKHNTTLAYIGDIVVVAQL
jgi:hypothetical protein